jgi:hypothetical protein
MRKFKKVLKFSIKWILQPIFYLLLVGAVALACYNVYNEGRYFGNIPKCQTEKVITVDGKTDLYAIVQFDSKRDDLYYIEKGMSCKDFDAWEESNKLKNVFGVSGVLYVILGILWIVGTILGFIIIALIICIPIVWLICFLSELWDNKVIGWINDGEPNKKYKDQF